MKAFLKFFTDWFNRTFNQSQFDLKDFEKLESKKYLQSVKQRKTDQEVKLINGPMGPYGGI